MLVHGMNRPVTLLPLHFVTTEAKNAVWKVVCGLQMAAEKEKAVYCTGNVRNTVDTAVLNC